MSTQVVNIKVNHLRKEKCGCCGKTYQNLEEWLKNENHVYIGRNMSFYVKGAEKSKWNNPFTVKKYGREGCLEKYEKYIKEKGELDVEELKGKVLGCWCKPEACHGDVLVDLCDKK